MNTVNVRDCTEGSDTYHAWKASGSQLTMVAWMDQLTTTTATAIDFTALAVSRGKGSNSQTKASLAVAQGALIGALIGAGVGRRAHIDKIIEGDTSRLIAQVAGGQYARPMATIVAVSGRAFTYSREGDSIPRADWLRLRVELNHASKACAKARALFDGVQEQVDALRAARLTG